VQVTRARFDELAEQALASLPRPVLRLLVDLEICVRARPGREAGRWRGSKGLLGLYTGLRRADMTPAGAAGPHQPARIVLYQRNLESLCGTEEELAARIAVTLRHEIGHHFGFDDRALRRLKH
jgi:predicted Zn-dependent protease with MMP-like domain